MTIGKRSQRWGGIALGVAIAIGGVLETGLVVAQWAARDSDQQMVAIDQDCPARHADGSRAWQAGCAARPSTSH